MNKKCIYKNYKWTCLSIFLALLDIGVKYWIKNHFLMGEVVYILPNINCCYVHNSGLAFGLFSDINVCSQWIFTWLILLIVAIFIVILYKSVQYNSIYDNISYSMIIGGALGNLYDRILYGTVVDFIDLYVGVWHWPTFNIADMEICIGIIVLMTRRIMIF